MNSNNYIFKNYFDVTLYFILSAVYPILMQFVQIKQTSVNDFASILNLLITSIFFFLSFFYDFYSRYNDYNGNSKWVKIVLFIGRLLYGLITGSLMFSLLMFGIKQINGQVIIDAMKVLLICAFMPIIISITELCFRLFYDIKSKL